MNRVAKFGSLLLAIFLAGGPLAACMLPGAVTSAEEQACCLEMADQCGSDQMPASHSCCKTLAPPHFAIAKKPFNLETLSQISYLSIELVRTVVPVRTELSRVSSSDHSPPQTPPPAFSILRI